MTTPNRRAALALSVLLGSALAPAVARANGRFPAANMLVARPGDPSRLVLRATYGLLFSNDGGSTWDWLCERVVGYRGNEDPSVVVTGSGAVIAGTFGGFARTTDGGCTWRLDSGGPQSIIDMALRPGAPDRVYAVSSIFSRVGDGGVTLFHSQLLVSDDAGDHWTSRLELDPSLLVDSVEVAPSDPERVYVSAIRPHGKDTRGVLLVSSDDGAHFAERALPFETTDRGVYVAAVDPKRADRVYLRTSGVDASRIVVTDDAGKTTRTVFQGGPLFGFALADDGATLYAGGLKDGVVAASTADLKFTKRSSLPIQCLAAVGSTLWACTPSTSGYVLGASTDGGATFAAKLKLAGMRGPVQCPAPGIGAECAGDWAALRELVGGGQSLDAGPAQPRAPAAPARSCGCALPGTRNGVPGAVGVVGIVTALIGVRARARGRRRLREAARSR